MVEIVTEKSHPNLFECFETISHDRGSGAGHSNYWVPPEWREHVPTAETALQGLTAEERMTISIGEASDIEAVSMRSDQLQRTNKMLASFFEDWDIFRRLTW